MKSMRFYLRSAPWIAALAALVVLAVAAGAEEYVLGPGDVIDVNVYQRQDLTRTVPIRASGFITLPPLGDVPASGKTTSDLARDLEDRFGSILRQNTQVTVTVLAFNSQRVNVQGQVNSPGSYGFETIPGLIDLLSRLGVTPQADLTRVQIVSGEGSDRDTEIVDVARAMKTGDYSAIPDLRRGDTIFVPAAGLGVDAMSGGSVVYVLGEVSRPGPYPAQADMDLFQLLSAAGGLTKDADLGRVDVLAGLVRGESYRIRIDLNREMQEGRKGLALQAGDAVIVQSRRWGPGRQAWGLLREGLGVSRDVLNLILIQDALND